jgi:hypothetical protein
MAARRAGSRLATTPTAPMTVTATVNAVGSVGLTW